MSILLDYIRMVSYGIIILSSLKGIFYKKFNNSLFIGDCIIACALFISAFGLFLGVSEVNTVRYTILTPATIVWATIHLYNIIKK